MSLIEEGELLGANPKYLSGLQRLAAAQSANQIDSMWNATRDIGPVWIEILESAFRRDASTLPKTKEAATQALRRLATQVVRSGHGTAEVREVVSEENLQRPTTEVIELLVSIPKSKRTQFQCILGIQGTLEEIRGLIGLRDFKILDDTNRTKLSADTKALEFFHRSTGQTLIYNRVEATNFQTAAREAVRRLRPVVDTLNLYKNQPALAVHEEILVRGDGRIRKIDLSAPSSRALHSRKHAISLTKDFLKNVSLVSDSRILNALELHSLAQSSNDSKVKLINLWSALESLVGRSGPGSILDRVTDAIVPIITWRRFDKILRYLAICLHQFGLCRTSPPAPGPFVNSNDSHIVSEELLAVLVRPKDHPEIVDLLRTMADHPLLCFRANSLWKLFSNPTTLKKDFKRSSDSLRWHISRIYRARNLIVHYGMNSGLTQQLLDNLQYYFSIVISRIMHDISLHPKWSCDESLSYWKLHFHYICDSLERDAPLLQVQDLLPNPKFIHNQRLWPKMPANGQ